MRTTPLPVNILILLLYTRHPRPPCSIVHIILKIPSSQNMDPITNDRASLEADKDHSLLRNEKVSPNERPHEQALSEDQNPLSISSSRSSHTVSPAEEEFPETDLANGIIGWEGQNDPSNPQNFSPTRKWGLLALISAMTVISPLASSMFSPAVEYMGADFGVSNEILLSFSVTIYLLGYTVRGLLAVWTSYSNQYLS